MSTPILATKLFIPAQRVGAVSRPRLVERLTDGLDNKLILVSAPAGFGKTTLVREWVAGLGRPVAWLSLDEGDSHPTRFLIYLVAALQTLVPNVGEGVLGLLHSPQPPPVEAILTALLNKLAALPGDFTLILDDYHTLDAVPLDNALIFLLDHLPKQMHIVIVTREDPNLPLARYRVQDQLVEIRAADLRFSSDEATEFLNRVMGLGLTSEEVTALESRTEGWIAGLHLAAISLQGHHDTAGFISSFTGSHHFVMDYLVEEVLQRQSQNVQTFLLRTSILNRLTGPLCDALTDQHDGQATLEMLENANLFIVPLDGERRWYRYHHLFADLLQQRLQQRHHEQIFTIHQRASLWYEENDHQDMAIEHALRAEDFGRAGQLIETVAETVWLSGVDSRLRRWLTRLPADLLLSSPRLCMFHAWYLLAGGDQAAADQLLGTVELAIECDQGRTANAEPQANNQPHGSDGSLQGRLATIQAFSAFYRGDVPAIIEPAGRALQCLPDQDLSWRSIATHLLADAYDFNGEVREAYQFRLAARQASKASGNVVQILIANLKLAINLRSQGQLHQVIEICQQQFEFAGENKMAQTVVAGWLLAIWGEALAELGELEMAVQKASQGVNDCERGGDLAMLGWSYLCLIRVLFTWGETTRAEKIAHKLDNLAREASVPPWILDLNSVWQARLWLAQGKLESVSSWIKERGLEPHRSPHYLHELESIILARLLIAQGQLREALALLQRQLGSAEASGRTTRVIEMLNLQALAFQAGGDTDRATASLERSLCLAEPGGFIRTFVDEGPPMAQLLYEALSRDIVPDYGGRLLAAFPLAEAEKIGQSKTQTVRSELIEPLSEREIEVLQLIAEGLTNSKIAATLFLSLNTVKVHTRNIYGKLGVHSRMQAVARARSLDIL